MGWYDIIDDVAQKQILKTDMGDNRLNGVTIGIVAKKYSKEMPGRVCVQIPVRDADANVLQWARVAMPSAGKKWGVYFLPEIGDQVLLAFEEGNIAKPYIIGCVHQDGDLFLSQMADEDNQSKCIKTKNGNSITIKDNVEGEGEKDKIIVSTSKEMCSLKLDNENQVISVSDKEKKNSMEMKLETGEIKIKSEKKLTMEIGDISITMNGENGKISIDCNKFTLKASDGIKLQTDSKITVSSGNASIEGSSGLKLSSGNSTIIEGSLIKIG